MPDEKEETVEEHLVVLPEGLQKEMVQLSVESPTYFDLETFFATLQGGKRYVEVENLTFTGSAERVMLDELKEDKLTYTMDVSIYYHTRVFRNLKHRLRGINSILFPIISVTNLLNTSKTFHNKTTNVLLFFFVHVIGWGQVNVL